MLTFSHMKYDLVPVAAWFLSMNVRGIAWDRRWWWNWIENGKTRLGPDHFIVESVCWLSAGGTACVLKQLSISTAMSSVRALWFVNILKPLVTHNCSSCLWWGLAFTCFGLWFLCLFKIWQLRSPGMIEKFAWDHTQVTVAGSGPKFS